MRMDRRAGLLAVGGAVEITYSGTYTDELVTMDGSSYRLLTLISSGTLAASAAVTGDIWICGGGAGGGNQGVVGGGAGYAATAMGSNFQSLMVTIGAAGTNTGTGNGGQTSISGDVSLSANGGNGINGWANCGNGGTGGGASQAQGSGTAGIGDGIAKKPFASSYYTYPYCDGGGGGGYGNSTSSKRRNGGAGGTNGGNGSSPTTGGVAGGAGGGHYGGAGGPGSYPCNASNATGYGSGGGGCGRDVSGNYGTSGTGYQGVCIIRIPA